MLWNHKPHRALSQELTFRPKRPKRNETDAFPRIRRHHVTPPHHNCVNRSRRSARALLMSPPRLLWNHNPLSQELTLRPKRPKRNETDAFPCIRRHHATLPHHICVNHSRRNARALVRYPRRLVWNHNPHRPLSQRSTFRRRGPTRNETDAFPHVRRHHATPPNHICANRICRNRPAPLLLLLFS